MDRLWYEENANIQGALRATAWRGGKRAWHLKAVQRTDREAFMTSQ